MHSKLTEEILKLSVAKFWDRAKLEWNFENAYQSEEKQTCLCGHYPIRKICVIKNKGNSSRTEVGNCCVNKFFDIEEGNKIFTSIDRLKKDPSKSMSTDAVEFLKRKNILNDYEVNFYNSIIKKRDLSDKQLKKKREINGKLLHYTSYEANRDNTRINIALELARKKPDFDPKFIISLKTSYEKTGKLTEKQKNALENIITTWKLE